MLCQLAHQFPGFVATFLQSSRQLRRRFREETITDLLMGSLITAGGGRVVVEFPDEPVTGADMEWNFVNRSDNTFFRLLLQAKQAYGEGGNWKRHCYKEILHTTGTSSKLQAEVLCDAARASSATYPLYIFYHPAHTCQLAQRDGHSHVAGVNLADGYLIADLVRRATSRLTRTRNKSLRIISPLLFDLSDLFCPGTVVPLGPFALLPGLPVPLVVVAGSSVPGFYVPPTPTDVQRRIVALQHRIRERDRSHPDVTLQVPEVARAIPDDVLAMIERGAGPGIGRSPSGNRWRVTFVSASPREGQG
jgi:hypothetical protein